MDFVYTPEGREDNPYKWKWEPGRISSPDAEIIERRTGLLFPEWVQRCAAGSVTAQHAFLYVMLRKENPGMEWDQVDFTPDEVGIVYDEDDQRQWWKNLEAAVAEGKVLNDVETGILEACRRQFGEQAEVADDGDAAEPDGVGPDPTQPPDGSGTQPTNSRPGSD